MTQGAGITTTFDLTRAINTELSFSGLNSIVSADFDNDGLSDVAVASPEGGTPELAILLSDGDGTFTHSVTKTDMPPQDALAAGDINGDGDADLVAASTDSRQLTVLYGDGTGAFTERTTLSTEHRPKRLEIGDLNGDGLKDIAVGTANRGGLGVFLAEGGDPAAGQGGFRTGDGVVEGVFDIRALDLGDIDGDGTLDAVGHQTGYGSVMSVLLGDDNGGFTLAGRYDPHDKPANANTVAIGDINGDGNADWALPETFPKTLEVLAGDGAGGIADRYTIEVDFKPRSVETGDFDRDGSDDLLLIGAEGTWALYTGLGGADGSAAEIGRVAEGSLNGDLDDIDRTALGDIDGNGLPDLLTTNDSSGGLISAARNIGDLGLEPLRADLQWTDQTGTDQKDKAVASATMPDGGVVVATSEAAVQGDGAVAVTRYDASGNTLWRDELTAGLDDPQAAVGDLVVDDAGNVYIAGSVELAQLGDLSTHLTGQNSNEPQHGARDLYVAKYGPDGGQAWIRQLGSADLDDNAELALTAEGVAVAGEASGPFTPTQQEPDTSDAIAVTGVSAGGNLQFSRLYDSGGNDTLAGLASDPSTGGLVLAGSAGADLATVATDGGDDFSAIPGLTAPGESDAGGMLLRLDAAGNVTRARGFELAQGPGSDQLDAMAVGPEGAVTLVGDTVGLDDGPGVPLVSVSVPFARRFDAEDNLMWTRQNASINDADAGQDGYSDVAIGPYGLAYVSGGARGHVAVYDDAGRLRADLDGVLFQNAGQAYDDGATTIAVSDRQSEDGTAAVYVGGGTDNDWAGSSAGERDAWTARFNATVEAPNRTPSLEAIPSQTVEENSPVGTAVVTASATDPDGDTFSYGLDGADASAFAIDSVSGEITLAASPDFEAPADADGDNTYELTVRATDPDGEAVDESFIVEVVDVNDTDDTAEPETPTDAEPDNPTDDSQARVFLAADGDLTLSSAAVVFGRGGDGESALIDQGVRNVSLDGNVDRIDLPVRQAETTFQVVNGQLEIRTGGDSLVELTGGLNQAVDLQFADGNATLAQTGAARFDLTGDASSTLTVDGTAETPELTLGSSVSATAGGATPQSPHGPVANVFLEADARFTTADPAEVFGRGGGQEVVELTPAARNVNLDGNVEQVELPADLNATTFEVVEGQLEISAGGTRLAAFTGGLNQTVTLQFGNGEGTLSQTGAASFTLTGPGGQAPIGPTPTTPDIGLDGPVAVDASADGRTFDAASGDTTLEFADGDYDVTVDGFAAGDALDFADVGGLDEAILNVQPDSDQSDGQQTLSATDPADGQAVTVTLTGLTAGQDGAVFNADSFADVFGREALVV